MKIIAHRGGAGYFAENTMAAFIHAIELGCDAAELDVHLTKDGQVIVHHDARLSHIFCRKPNGNWLSTGEEIFLESLTLDEIKTYTVGVPNPQIHDLQQWPNLLPSENQSIPTLKEVIELSKQKSKDFELIIEIKSNIFEAAQRPWKLLVDAVLGIIQETNFEDRATLCAFDWGALSYAKQKSPKIRTWFTTHPFSWLVDGVVPEIDLPPRKQYLLKLRQAYKDKKADWYAGFQPANLEDTAQAIKRAGGDAWFCYHSDCTTETVKEAYSKEIKIAAWSLNLRDPKTLSELYASKPHALCLDYPKYRVIENPPEVEEYLRLAEMAYKQKSWSEAITRYQLVLREHPNATPVQAFIKLAIAQRQIKEYFESERTILKGLSIFPNHVGLLIEYAALENIRQNWDAAIVLWLKSKTLSKKFSALNYTRYAIACVMGGRNEYYENLVIEGLSCYPDNLQLLYRAFQLNAIQDYNLMRWESSYKKFKILEKNSSCNNISIPTKFFLLQTYLEMTLEKGGGNIEEHLTYHNDKFDAQHFVGIQNCLRSARNGANSSTRGIWKDLEICYNRILSYVKHTDASLVYDNNAKFISLIDDFSNKYDNDIEYELLPTYAWFLLANLFLKSQHFDLYYDAREKALLSTTAMDTHRFRGGPLKIRAHAEFRDKDKFNQAVDLFKLNQIDLNRQESLFVEASRIYLGDLQSFKNVAKSNFNKLECEFSKYISGKSIAIVGPIDTGSLNGPEIDKFDVVIRFNYNGMEGFAPEKFGTKTNASFYISKNLPRNELSLKKVHHLNQLDWIISDYNHKIADKCFEGVIKPIRTRFKAGHNFANPFFKGTPNGVQRVLLDLLRFDVGKIKVFNTNIFLTNNYVKTYRSGYHTSVSAFNFTRHDPVSNFILLKYLKDQDIIMSDEQLTEILKMTPKEYVHALNDRYGRTRIIEIKK